MEVDSEEEVALEDDRMREGGGAVEFVGGLTLERGRLVAMDLTVDTVIWVALHRVQTNNRNATDHVAKLWLWQVTCTSRQGT